jgi:hypothetical protein
VSRSGRWALIRRGLWSATGISENRYVQLARKLIWIVTALPFVAVALTLIPTAVDSSQVNVACQQYRHCRSSWFGVRTKCSDGGDVLGRTVLPHPSSPCGDDDWTELSSCRYTLWGVGCSGRPRTGPTVAIRMAESFFKRQEHYKATHGHYLSDEDAREMAPKSPAYGLGECGDETSRFGPDTYSLVLVAKEPSAREPDCWRVDPVDGLTHLRSASTQ